MTQNLLIFSSPREIPIPDEAGVNKDFPVPTRQVPDEFGGYTEVHGAYTEVHGGARFLQGRVRTDFHPCTPG